MLTLRPYQVDCVDAVLRDLAEVQSAACLLPTGAGKTVIFAALVQALIAASGGSALVLSHIGLLTEQTEERFIQFFPELRAGVLQGNRRPQPGARVVVSTMQTSRELGHAEMLKKRLTNPVKYVIVDEMQMLPTPSYETIRTHFPDAKLIGFTATPFRGSRIMTGYVDRVSYSISLQEIIDMGYLVPPAIRVMQEHSDVAATMGDVLGLYMAHERGNGAIVFMRSKTDARALKVAFNDVGVSCRAITDDLTGNKRHDLLADFNAGKIDVLTTVNVLSAGFDSPRVRAVFMPYGASSPAIYIQRVGRALRPDVARGKIEGRVYVAGEAPGISTKTYERLTQRLLLAGGSEREQSTFRDDLELNDYHPHSEVMHYTREVCEAVKRFERLGLDHFAKMLDEKNFPPKYMASITSLLDALPKNGGRLPGGESFATEGQKAILFKAGFGETYVATMSKREADVMIIGMKNLENASRPPSYVLTEGTHRGKHVSELPPTYCSIVKKRYPNSSVARTIIDWEKKEA